MTRWWLAGCSRVERLSRWRRILQRGDGTVVDLVACDSLAHARAGAAGITGEMAGSPVHDTIDHSTVDWQPATLMQHVAQPAAAAKPPSQR